MLDARGVMEPWQEPRHGRGWLILLLGITVFAAFGAVVGYAYFKGLPGIGGEPPLIKAQEGPYRHAPSDRGGLAVPNTNSSIVTVLRPQNEPPRVERILPAETSPPLESAEPDADIETTAVPPDQPLASLNTPEEDAAATLDPTDPAAAIALPYPRSKPVPPEPVVEAEPSETTISALPQVEPAAPPEEPAPEPQLPEPAPEPAAAAPAPGPQLPEPEPQLAELVPEPAAAAPPVAAAPAPGPQRLVRADPAAGAAPAPQRPASGVGIYRLQLAAVRSEGGLTQAWADLRQRYPAALGGVNPQVERTDTTSGPLFRLQAGPFTSRESAANACGSIRGSGGQCFIVGPIGQ